MPISDDVVPPVAQHELGHRERLGDVVVGAELQTQHAVDLVVAGGEKHDRDVGLGPDGAADIESVEIAGKSDVEEDELGAAFGDHLERPLTGRRLVGAVAVAPEVQLDEVGDVRIVLDDDDDGFFAHAVIFPHRC